MDNEWWIAGTKDGEHRLTYPVVRGQIDATSRIVVCRVGSHGSSKQAKERDWANAHLIAAAPKLLSALQAMLESFDFLMGEASPLGDVQKGVIRGAFVTAMQDGKLTTADAMARRAIAAARPAQAGNEEEAR
jgi:hypothetical protein